MQTTTLTPPLTALMTLTDAMNAHDPDAVAACFTENGRMDAYGAGDHPQGREAIRASMEILFHMYSGLRVEKTVLLSDGDRYAAEWFMTGVHSGDVPGLPATGRSFRLTGAGVGEVRDGLIVRAAEYWNGADFLVQVGILPPPGA
jgi:steroid delta-isomerase-like uncharacterized protein